MADIPRLNGVIRALEEGKSTILTFTTPDTENAIALADSGYDGVIFEMEHNPLEVRDLRDYLQYMLDRRQIVEQGTVAPKVAPFVRIPPNGGEMNQWIAKQVLDIGVYGIIWPHVSTVEAAHNAVAACRYPRPKGSPRFEPPGQRGDAPRRAARYWGLTQQEYYTKADVWPLDPQGEILVVIMVEEARAIDNLPQMLKEVPGIGAVLIGEGDLSQDMGIPRQYDHPTVVEAMATVRSICKEHNVPCGHPHVGAQNVERVVQEGYRFLVAGPVTSHAALQKGLQLVGRA